ncbi:MAG: VCBS repeat-containing protein [Planctomycetota bacterium]
MRCFSDQFIKMRLALLALIGIGTAFAPSQVQAQAPAVLASIKIDYRVAWVKEVALAGKGKPESIVVCGTDGRMEIFRLAGNKTATPKPGASLQLEHPKRSLCCFAPILDPAGPPQLVVLTPKGCFVYRSTPDGYLETKALRLARRAKLLVRTTIPMLGEFARDATGDGLMDIVVPKYRSCALFVNQGGASGKPPKFRKTAEVEVRVSSDIETSGGGNIDDLASRLYIPDLNTIDVNGDGRPDLVVKQKRETRFHLQDAKGGIPTKPTSILNLRAFRDTTQAATVRPGYTLAGTEKARSLMRDLDGDGIPDYVIAHRRKVWVFHGSKAGPQFSKPSSILKTADDLTAIWLANLNDDDKVDLLIVRVQVPTIGTLLTGLLGSISVDFGAYGYANQGGRRFATKPQWRRSLVFKLPSLTEILRNPEAILRRFENAGGSLPPHVKADFNGDGAEDLVMFSKAERGFDLWRGDAAHPAPPANSLDRILRRVLFEDDKDEWNIDRLLEWIESLGNQEVTRLTQGRPATISWQAPERKSYEAPTIRSAPLDASPGEELILSWQRRAAGGGLLIEILDPR